MTRYLALIEKLPDGYSAYVPDVPGCEATGGSIEEVSRRIRGALELHFEGLRADGDPLPEARTAGDYVAID